MKKAKLFSILGLSILMIGSATLLTNCKKGDTGPAGAAGTNGKDGNANVKSQTSTNLTWTFNSSTLAYETNIAVPAITQDIVDKGAVLVYLQEGNSSSQLPTSSMYDSATIVFFNFEYSVGNVKVTFTNSDLDNTLVPQSTTKFKIVAMTASAKGQNPVSGANVIPATVVAN
ncbi:MAG: hypothetical protein JNL60_15170 [Bacteroidia bacterium]|nr:hypothetical protein [Bacteroidia bacterium]